MNKTMTSSYFGLRASFYAFVFTAFLVTTLGLHAQQGKAKRSPQRQTPLQQSYSRQILQLQQSTNAKKVKGYVPSRPPRFMDGLFALSDGKQMTLVPQSSVLYYGSKCGIERRTQMDPKQKGVSFADFKKGHSGQVAVIRGALVRGVWEYNRSEIDRGPGVILIAVNDKGMPTGLVKINNAK